MLRTYPAATARIVPWLQRVAALLLVCGGAYLLAIDLLSPHHLAGLRWLAFLVVCVGFMMGFLSTRFRWVEVAWLLAAVVFGLVAIGDLAVVGTSHPGPRSPAGR